MRINKTRQEDILRKPVLMGEIKTKATSLKAEFFFVNKRPLYIQTNRPIDIDDIMALEKSISEQYGLNVTILGLSERNCLEHICIESDAVYLSPQNYPYLSFDSLFPIGNWDGKDVAELSEILSDCYSEFGSLFERNIVGAMRSSFIKRSDFSGRGKKRIVLSNSFFVDAQGKAMVVTDERRSFRHQNISNSCIIAPDTQTLIKLAPMASTMEYNPSFLDNVKSAIPVCHFRRLNTNFGLTVRLVEFKEVFEYGY